MSLAYEMQKFLRRKLEETGLKKKAFAEDSGIPYQSICKTINAANHNVELKTALRLTKYFNCSLDEVVGRNDFAAATKKNFSSISIDEISISLKNYIKKEMDERSITPYQLAKNCGLGENTIYEYVKDNNTKKMLSAGVILSIANYFETSLDDMVGRVPTTILATIPMPSALQALGPEAATSIQQIRSLIKSSGTMVPKPSKPSTPSKTLPDRIPTSKDLSRT